VPALASGAGTPRFRPGRHVATSASVGHSHLGLALSGLMCALQRGLRCHSWLLTGTTTGDQRLGTNRQLTTRACRRTARSRSSTEQASQRADRSPRGRGDAFARQQIDNMTRENRFHPRLHLTVGGPRAGPVGSQRRRGMFARRTCGARRGELCTWIPAATLRVTAKARCPGWVVAMSVLLWELTICIGDGCANRFAVATG
jgi:hypothetical protein